MQQDVREAGLPVAGGAVPAVAPQRHHQACARQALQRGAAGATAHVQQHGLPRPVEDGGVVSGRSPAQRRQVRTQNVHVLYHESFNLEREEPSNRDH